MSTVQLWKHHALGCRSTGRLPCSLVVEGLACYASGQHVCLYDFESKATEFVSSATGHNTIDAVVATGPGYYVATVENGHPGSSLEMPEAVKQSAQAYAQAHAGGATLHASAAVMACSSMISVAPVYKSLQSLKEKTKGSFYSSDSQASKRRGRATDGTGRPVGGKHRRRHGSHSGGGGKHGSATGSDALALAARGETIRPAHGPKHLVLPFFRGRWLRLAFSSDGMFLAAYGEVTPEMKRMEEAQREEAAAAAAEEKLRSRGRGKGKDRGKDKDGVKEGGKEGGARPRRGGGRLREGGHRQEKGNHGVRSHDAVGVDEMEPGAAAEAAGASEDQVKMARADRVVAVWQWATGKLLGVGMPRQSITQLRVQPFEGYYRGARPEQDQDQDQDAEHDQQARGHEGEGGQGRRQGAATSGAKAGSGDGKGGNHSAGGHSPGTMELAKRLCVTTSGTGHLRQWRLGEDRTLREGPVLQVSRREEEEFVDHAWVVTPRPDDEAGAGGEGAGGASWQPELEPPVLVAASRRGVVTVLAPRRSAEEEAAQGAVGAKVTRGGPGHGDSDGRMVRFEVKETFWAEFPELQSAVQRAGLARGGAAPSALGPEMQARGIVELTCVEAWGRGFVLAGTHGYLGIYERCRATDDDSDEDDDESDLDEEEMRRPHGGHPSLGAGGDRRKRGSMSGMGMPGLHGGAGGREADEPMGYYLLRAFLPGHQDVLDDLREQAGSRPGARASLSGLDRGTGTSFTQSIGGTRSASISSASGQGPAGAGAAAAVAADLEDRLTIRSVSTSPGDGLVVIGSGRMGLRSVALGLAESLDEREDPSRAMIEKGAHTGAVTSLDCGMFAPLVASSGQDSTLRLYDYLEGVCEVEQELDSPAVDVSMHPTCYLVVAALPDRLRIFNVCATTKTLRPWREHTSVRHVGQVQFSPGGALLAACSGLTVQLISSYDMKQRYQLSGHVGVVQALAWADDDTLLASVGEDGAVVAWDPSTGRRVDRMTNVTKGVHFDSAVVLGQGHGRAIVAAGCGTAAPVLKQSKKKKSKRDSGAAHPGAHSGKKPSLATLALRAQRHSHEPGLPLLQVSKDGDAQVYRTGARLTALERGPHDRALFAGTAGGSVRAYPWPFPAVDAGDDEAYGGEGAAGGTGGGGPTGERDGRSGGSRPRGLGPDTSSAAFRVSSRSDRSKPATAGSYEALDAQARDAPPCTELQLHAGPVSSLRLSVDRKLLFSAGLDGSVFLVAIPQAKEERVRGNVQLRAATRVPGQGAGVPRSLPPAVPSGGAGDGSSPSSSPSASPASGSASASAAASQAMVQYSWEAPTARAFNNRVGLVERDAIREMFERVHTLEEELSQSRAAAEDVLKLREREWADERQQLLDDSRAEQRRLKDEYARLQRESMEQAKRDEGIIADLKAHHERQVRVKQNEYEHQLAMEIDRFDRLDEQLTATKQQAEQEMQRMARERAEKEDALEEYRNEVERKLRAEIDEHRQKLVTEKSDFETKLSQTEEEAEEALRKERFFGQRDLIEEQKRTAERAGEVVSLRKQLDESRRRLDRAGELAEEANYEIIILQEQLRQSKEQSDSKDRQRRAAEETVMQLKRESAALRSDNQTLQHHRSILEHNIEDMKMEREPLALRVKELQKLLNDTNSELTTTDAKMKGMQATERKSEMSQNGMKAEVARLRKQYHALEAKLRAVLRDIEIGMLSGQDGDAFGALRDLHSKHVKEERIQRRHVKPAKPSKSRSKTRGGSDAAGAGSGSGVASKKAGSEGKASGVGASAIAGEGQEGDSYQARIDHLLNQNRIEQLHAYETIGELRRQRDYMQRGARALARQASQTSFEAERKSRSAMVDNSRLLSECNKLRREVATLHQDKRRLEEQVFLAKQKGGIGGRQPRGGRMKARAGAGAGTRAEGGSGSGSGRPPRSHSPLGLGPAPSMVSDAEGAGEGKASEFDGSGGGMLSSGVGVDRPSMAGLGGLGSPSALGSMSVELEMGTGLMGGSMVGANESEVLGQGEGSTDSLAALARGVRARHAGKGKGLGSSGGGGPGQRSVATLRGGPSSSGMGGSRRLGGVSQLSVGENGNGSLGGRGSRVGMRGGRRSDSLGLLRSPMRGSATRVAASTGTLPAAGRGVVGGASGSRRGSGGLLPSEEEAAAAVNGGRRPRGVGAKVTAGGGSLTMAGLEAQLRETNEELTLHNQEMAMLRGEAGDAGAGSGADGGSDA